MPKTKYAKKIEENIEEESVVDNKEYSAPVKLAPIKKEFKAEDGIPCRSVTVGGLVLEGVKSNDLYRWTEYGDITEVEYRDLASLVRSKSPYIFYPYFVIDDDDFIKEFPQLKQFYDESYTVEDLEQVLHMPINQMIKQIDILPNGAKETLKNVASTKISTGELDSVKRIKALDDYFGTELNLLASMFE